MVQNLKRWTLIRKLKKIQVVFVFYSKCYQVKINYYQLLDGEISSTWGDRETTLHFGRVGVKESSGPRKENSSLKGPLLNHLTSEKTKQNFRSILMLQADCIYLGLINLCPETFQPLHLHRRLINSGLGTLHPLHLPRRLITLCPTTNVILTKEYSKYPAWLTFPLSLPQTSL